MGHNLEPAERLSKGSIQGLRNASGCALPRRATISPLEGLRTARPRSTTTTDRPTDRPTDRDARGRTEVGRCMHAACLRPAALCIQPVAPCLRPATPHPHPNPKGGNGGRAFRVRRLHPKLPADRCLPCTMYHAPVLHACLVPFSSVPSFVLTPNFPRRAAAASRHEKAYHEQASTC